MGTSFDCFDTKSSATATNITSEQRALREKLLAALSKRGFKGFRLEWWHFTYIGTRRQPKLRDFIVMPIKPN
jgi:D-alanyl-D-alanine dipeptidase